MTTLPLRVRIKSWVAAGDDADLFNGEGFVIDPKGFKGWDDGVDITRDQVRRPQAVGSFDATGFEDSRVVTLSGSCWGETPQKTNWFGNQLTGLLAGDTLAQVNVDHQGGTLFGYARLAVKPTFEVSGADARDALWSLALWFPDPRKYGVTRSFPVASSVTAFHYGNYAAYPKLIVTGVMGSGYTVNGPGGKTFSVNAPVTSGHPHTIDLATGYVWIDGAISYGIVTVAQTWPIPPGVQVPMTLVPVAGSGTLTVSDLRDVFV